MSLDRAALAEALTTRPRVARVVVAAVDGSAPREAGAAMLVWANDGPYGQSGTIGGGALEYAAAAAARDRLAGGGDMLTRHPLGPALGQCCGGAVVLATEIWDAARLAALDGPAYLRRLEGDTPAPLTLKRADAEARNAGTRPEVRLADGWLLEPVAAPARTLWLYGAGHVGRAIAATLSPLPDIALTWIDTAPKRFPDALPEGVTQLIAANPADLVRYAPPDAQHLILTYSHALDLEICHRLLSHGFAAAGLIGSKTKWARFRSRLAALGHAPDSIARIRCPIGDPALGKHPQAIAIGVAADLLAPRAAQRKEARA